MSEPCLNLPAEAPVMVLPNAVLLPHALLPLHIFEQQYREMLHWSLERNRLFCIALRDPETSGSDPQNFNPIGGLGLIRACVGADDGTSNLILQGLVRVKFGPLTQSEPFRIATIEEFKSELTNVVEAEALAIKVVEICGKLHDQGRELPPALIQKLPQVTCPQMLADIVAQTFVRCPNRQQILLEEPSVSQRLRTIISYLQPEVTA